MNDIPESIRRELEDKLHRNQDRKVKVSLQDKFTINEEEVTLKQLVRLIEELFSIEWFLCDPYHLIKEAYKNVCLNLKFAEIESRTFVELPGSFVIEISFLARDLFLVHKKYPKFVTSELLNRLKDPGQYQGARFELAIIYLFVSQKFEIGLIDTPRSERKSEFFLKIGANKVAVEAKKAHDTDQANLRRDISNLDVSLIKKFKKFIQDSFVQRSSADHSILFINPNIPTLENSEYSEARDAFLRYLSERRTNDNLLAVVIWNFNLFYFNQSKFLTNEILLIEEQRINSLNLDSIKNALDQYSFTPYTLSV